MGHRELVSVLVLLFCVGSSADPLQAFEIPCLLEVELSGPSGRGLEGLTVELEDEHGRIVDTAVSKGGRVSFCDFGFGKHSIVVNRGSCAELRMSNIQANFLRTRRIRLSVPVCGEEDVGGTPTCYYFIRVTDRKGLPVNSARLLSEDGQVLDEADEYGRMLHVLGVRNSISRPTVEAPGFQPYRLALACEEPKRQQVSIYLWPTRNQ